MNGECIPHTTNQGAGERLVGLIDRASAIANGMGVADETLRDRVRLINGSEPRNVVAGGCPKRDEDSRENQSALDQLELVLERMIRLSDSISHEISRL